MDLYEVLDGGTGRSDWGPAPQPRKGLGTVEVDILINILRPLGTDFAPYPARARAAMDKTRPLTAQY